MSILETITTTSKSIIQLWILFELLGRRFEMLQSLHWYFLTSFCVSCGLILNDCFGARHEFLHNLLISQAFSTWKKRSAFSSISSTSPIALLTRRCAAEATCQQRFWLWKDPVHLLQRTSLCFRKGVYQGQNENPSARVHDVVFVHNTWECNENASAIAKLKSQCKAIPTAMRWTRNSCGAISVPYKKLARRKPRDCWKIMVV